MDVVPGNTTLWRWQNAPTLNRQEQTGNAPAQNLRGEHQFLLILGIDCSGMVWVRFAKVAGTTVEIFDDYVRTILNTLAPPPAPQRTFMWDNLTAHNCARVYNRVVAAGHRVLRRPAYRPVDGPIEYVFNQLQCQLTNRIGEVTDDVSFSTLVHDIITKLNGFDATFVHCGYT